MQKFKSIFDPVSNLIFQGNKLADGLWYLVGYIHNEETSILNALSLEKFLCFINMVTTNSILFLKYKLNLFK
jgi:hypothetical protein